MAPLAPAGAGLGPAEPLPKLTDPLNRWSAWVTIDDQPVEVYKVEHESRKSTCYIEAVEGKEFKVVFNVLAASHDGTVPTIYPQVDGMKMAGFVLRKVEKPHTWDGQRISTEAVRPFTFAKINLTDETDLATTSEAIVKNLGTIQIPVRRVHYLGCLQHTPKYSYDARKHMIDERSKKAAISHQACFGAARTSVYHGQSCSVDYVDKEDDPVYVLDFKYRSRTLLELDDIVEPLSRTSPSPEPAPRSPHPSGDSPNSNKGKKRKTDVITLSDDDDEDELPASAENARLKDGGVKEEKPKVKDEPLRMKVKKEGGQTVIDLLD